MSAPDSPEQRALREAARLISISAVQRDQGEHDRLLAYAQQTTQVDPLDLAIATSQLAALAIIGLANAKGVDREVALQHVLDVALDAANG